MITQNTRPDGTLRASTLCTRRHEVAQVVEALRYEPEGSGFDSR